MATTKTYVSYEKLGLYDEKIKKVITDGDAAALKDAKDYADSLATNYDAAGAAASALDEAKLYADGKDAAIADAKKAGDDAAAAALVADGKAVAAQESADAAQADVDELAGYVGTIPTDEAYTDISTVIGYVNKKAEETLAAAQGGSSETAASVKAALDTYKTENNAKVDKNIEDIAGLQAALDEEKSRAEGIEGGLETRLAAVEGDYLKNADKEELQGNIDTVNAAIERLTNGVSADEVDGVNDLINYVKEHGAEVTGIQEDIAENAEAIEGVVGRMTTAEGKITELEGAVATKVEQTAYDTKVAALEGEDTAIKDRLADLEGAIGESGSVADDIATAKQEAIDAAAADATAKANKALEDAKKYADDEDAKIELRVDELEAASATHALASDVNAIDGRVTVVEGKVSTLETEMDAVEARVLVNEGAIDTLNTAVAGKASQTDFELAVGRIDANEAAIGAFVEVSEAQILELFA